MPPRLPAARVEGILAAIGRIRDHVEGVSFEVFAADRKTLDAVLYNLAVIGEAANSLAVAIGDRFPGLPWAEMRGMRNIVVHEYFGVSPRILWETIVVDLPALAEKLNDLLRSGRLDSPR